MADRKPLKVLPDGGGDSTGLGEFVAADTVGVVDGGTGLAAVGNNQLLTGHSSSTTGALTSQSNLTFDGNHLTLGDGDLVIGTAGHGIDFSATSDGAGTDSSELLDDYEEGTFTPLLGAHSSNGTHSYTTQVGRYTKIGNVVHIWLNLEINTLNTSGTISGNLEIRGLPYTSDNVSGQMYMGTFLPSGLVVSGVGPVVMMGINEAKLSMAEANDNAGYSMFTSSDVASGDRFYIQVSYHTA
tara:strand:+ start:3690 stop:4412 length:723 start_codon:yes stop_codon:yes gene_type:complete